MGLTIGNYIGIGKNSGISWQTYWTALISAVVENAATTNVVLTFPSGKPSLLVTDLSCTVNGVARTINSASWSGGVWTAVLASAVIYGDVVVMTFGKTGQTANVTNNVAAEAELTTYITGLTTPLSTNQKIDTNNFILALKSGLSISALSEVFDRIVLYAAETSETALKNLAQDACHPTLAGGTAPVFWKYKGYQGNGSGYIESNFVPSVNGVRYQRDNCSYGVKTNINIDESKVILGMRDAGSTYSNYLFLRDTNKLYYINQCNLGGSVDNTNSRGVFIFSRNAGNQTNVYLNGAKTADTDSSVKLETNEFYTLAYNAGGSPLYISSNQVAAEFQARKLTDGEETVIRNAINNYLNTIEHDKFSNVMANYGFNSYDQNSGQYYNGKTYVVYAGDDDDPYIRTYTHATDAWSVPVKVGTNPLANGDWHGSPSLLIDSSGYLHVMWGAHNSAIQYVKSDNPEDISAWTAMSSPAASGTYPRLFQIGSTLYVFYRAGSTPYSYKTSADGGATWSAAVGFCNNVAYFDIKQYGNYLLFAGVGRDSTGYDLYNIYFFSFDGTNWRDAVGDIDTLTLDPDTDNILAYDSGTAYTPTATPYRDSDGNLYIFFMELTEGTGDPIGTYAYKMLKFNGETWDDYDIGVSTPRKSGDASAIEKIGSTLYVYLATGGSSALMGGNIERWKSTNNGVTWSKDQTIKEGNFVMPVLVKDGLSNAKLLFSEYDGVNNHFNLFGFLWGENGFVN